jgi:hypothetical protein
MTAIQSAKNVVPKRPPPENREENRGGITLMSDQIVNASEKPYTK